MKRIRLVCCGLFILFGSLLWCLPKLVADADDALVYVINIRDAIGQGLRAFLENGIEKAEKANADAIIFDVDTPGGEVDAAVRIVRAIQETEIPTIAYVNRQAISAGAIISLACDQIVMTSGGTIGDAAPVVITGEELGEKAVSYIRATIRSTAEKQGRNADVAAAMVDKRLYLVELSDGQIVALRVEAYDEKKAAGEEMVVIAAGGEDGELLTLTTEDARRYRVIDGEADTFDELLAMYEIVSVKGERKALTRTAVEAQQTESKADRPQIIKSLENATVERVKETLADQFVLFITSPVVSALLLALGGIGIWIELQSPGFGFPGILGIVCLALVFGGHRLLDITVDYAILGFIVGVGLLLLELFVIPGFGIAGVAGIGVMLGSLFFVFRNAYELQTALMSLGVSVITIFAGGIALAYLLPKTRTMQRFVLQTALDSNMVTEAQENPRDYLGKKGVALTPLRPSGTVRVGDRRLDVVTSGDFIPADTAVKITHVEGTKIFVEAADEA